MMCQNPSIPVPDAIADILDKLRADDTLANRTTVTAKQILKLLRFCFETTYFSYKGESTNKHTGPIAQIKFNTGLN